MNLTIKRFFFILLFLSAAVLVWLSGLHKHITLENIQQNRELLLMYIEQNYIFSVLIFLGIYITTAFFVPGTLALTVASGFFFGFVTGAFYSLVGACLGATAAFLTSRHLIGSWIQKKFSSELETFNKELSRHGYNYLLVFRIVPVLPFFMVNYLAGITHVSKWTFLWSTAVGMLPGALICAYAGQQLGVISSPEEIVSTEIMISLFLLAVLILLPPAIRHTKKLFG